MTSILRDARWGIRLLRRHPGFTAVAVVALALGIGANAAIFSVVYATLIAPLPYENADRIVIVWSRIQNQRNATAAGDYVEWVRRSKSFDALHAWTGGRVSVASSSGSPELVPARVATPGFLTAHGFRMSLGRDFLPEEGVVGKDQAVIVTHQFWRSRFGGDPDIVNRQVRVDGKPHTLVGVLAPGTADRLESQLFMPLAFTPEQLNHDFHWLLVLGRLKPGVTLAQANADMADVTKRMAEDFPKSNVGWRASVEPLKNNFLGQDLIATLWMLLGAVGFVLLIACANVANLLLARGMARQREVAVRASLGASRGRLVRQLFTESVVLAAAGGALGIALAYWLTGAIMALVPPDTLPSEADVRMSVPVLLFTLSVSLLSGVLFGCAPAWQVTTPNLSDVLKQAGRSMIAGRQWMRRAFVVAEFALALTLLAGAGLAIASLVRLTAVDLGFRTDHLLTFTVPVPDGRLQDPQQIEAFYRRLQEQMRAIPGVTSVSVSTGLPVFGTNFGMPFEIVGSPVKDPSQRPGAGFNMVTPEYFATLGIPMSRGRAFTEQDSANAPRVAIVNDAFVRQYFKDVNPLEQRIVIEQLIPGVTKLGPGVEWQIVGVYQAVRNRGPRGDFPEIDVPFAQSPWPQAGVAIRTALDPDSVRKSAAAVLNELDPDLPISDLQTMDQVVYRTLASDRFRAFLFGGFAAVALVLAALGIYGVMSFTVAQRTHEIGLRMALGAGRDRVVREILAEGVTTALIGAALGSVGAYLVGRAMQGMLFGVKAVDPVAFSVVAGILLASAVLACLVPAMRAASVDPMTALRQE
ncbi:MAG TPA: ABC transporter permease [Vicinamibacterales bacterium]|jgi:predicted permease|nr:ABC transporter permease [Vicinamibacterales bacterium]